MLGIGHYGVYKESFAEASQVAVDGFHKNLGRPGSN